LNPELTLQAEAASFTADAVIAVGTSLQVHPAASYILDPLLRGVPGVWLDTHPTDRLYDLQGDIREAAMNLVPMWGEVDETMPLLASLLMKNH
jgi:NAD-dependent SIR2 family protein deacetylase